MFSYFCHGGLRLAFLDHVGPGAQQIPILLIHGFASSINTNWVNTGWVKALSTAGHRVIAIENRGHGASDKPHDAQSYATPLMAEDAAALLDHLGVSRCFVMGYSMGARIAAFLALAHPQRVAALALSGLGIHLVEGVGLPLGIAEALETAEPGRIIDPTQKMFRLFAEANKGDLTALAACIRGSRQVLTREEIGQLAMPVLVSVGTEDPIAGAPQPLAALMPQGRAFSIQGRDHNRAVGDKSHIAAMLRFLSDESRAL